MWAQFEQHGIEVERFPAVDGSLPEVATRTASLKAGINGRRLGAGAYACFQSHRKIWWDLIASGGSHAMVLEDDLIIADGFKEFLADGWVPRDADFVKLETRNVRVQLNRACVQVSGGRYLARLKSSHFGTGCYIISAAAALRLHELTVNAHDAIDEMIFDASSQLFSTLMIYQMVPAPVIQGDRFHIFEGRETWVQTSITQRFGAGEVAYQSNLPLPGRIYHRVAAEISARVNGTNYTFIPHG
jgi:glycosyl transferase family 25